MQFVSFVLDDAQSTWGQILPQQGVPYRKAKLVLFRDATIPLAEWRSPRPGLLLSRGRKGLYRSRVLRRTEATFGAPGEFAEAYVLAHEIGHHVQNLIGIEAKMRAAQRQNPGAANALSVAMELQADCLAGVWAHSTGAAAAPRARRCGVRLKAAAAVGDDRIQRMSRGAVNPETFTHGSSAQRRDSFKRGFHDGARCSLQYVSVVVLIRLPRVPRPSTTWAGS